MVFLYPFNEVLDHEVQAGANAGKVTAVLRADVVQLKEVIEHLRVTPLQRCVQCSLQALPHPHEA